MIILCNLVTFPTYSTPIKCVSSGTWCQTDNQYVIVILLYTTPQHWGVGIWPNFLRAFWGFSAIFSCWHKKYFFTQLLVKLIKLCIYSFSAKLMWPLFQKNYKYWPWFTQKSIMPFTVSPSRPSHGLSKENTQYLQFINTKWSYIWGWFYSNMQ